LSAEIKQKLDRAIRGDVDALVELDGMGLLMGPGESDNVAKLQKDLDKNGKTTVCDIPLSKDERIPDAFFAEAAPVTEELYGFKTDWVPGFCTNYKMGLLFAGCAWYSLDDFFAVFIIRKAFATSPKWLIYGPTELLAHELCHVARIAYNSATYEEVFAYQTASSGFRRLIGGLLRSPMDTYVLLGSVAVLLVSQIANVTLREPEQWDSMPMPLAWGALIAAFAFIGGRYIAAMARFKRLKSLMAELTKPAFVMPTLFRCSDAELDKLSACTTAAELREQLTTRIANERRWQITAQRFLPELKGAPTSPSAS
jgi:hypothetical protein